MITFLSYNVSFELPGANQNHSLREEMNRARNYIDHLSGNAPSNGPLPLKSIASRASWLAAILILLADVSLSAQPPNFNHSICSSSFCS